MTARLRRRDLLGLGAIAGATLGARRPDGRSRTGVGGYGGPAAPPAEQSAEALDPLLRPPPFEPGPSGRLRDASLWVREQPLEVANGRVFPAWTYNGRVPGPVIRATEGDRLRVHFRNFGVHPHNVHFHGRHDIGQDGWQPIAAGDQQTYEFEAGPVGLHPYHCHALPVSEHIARGLYGALIVDPLGGRPPAHELSLVLCGFDLDGDGQNDLYAWNGVAGGFDRFPIKVPVGELVRVYLLNMVSGDPVASFHLHAETFDVYRGDAVDTPHERTDVVTLGQTERVILEFRLPRRGRYMFHPHQVHMAENGAMGWFSAI